MGVALLCPAPARDGALAPGLGTTRSQMKLRVLCSGQDRVPYSKKKIM